MESGKLAEMAFERINQGPLIALEDQQRIYSEACKTYGAGEFQLAADAFSGLVLANPYETAYWRGLASARQMEKKYADALSAWAMASLTDDEDGPEPHYRAAECLFLLGEMDEVEKALKLASDRGQGDESLMKKITWLKNESSKRNSSAAAL